MTILLLLSLLLVGCGDLPTTPGAPEADDRPAQFTVSVPNGRVYADELGELDIIEVTVTDAGGGIDGFQAYVHHGNEASWAPAWDDPRKMTQTQIQGGMRFTWVPGHYHCGRVRVAITLTRTSGVSQGVLLRDVQYGVSCQN